MRHIIHCFELGEGEDEAIGRAPAEDSLLLNREIRGSENLVCNVTAYTKW